MKFISLRGFVAITAFWSVAAAVYAAPDLNQGKKIDQEKCYACHAKKTGFSNGDMIYTRSDRKVTSLARLKAMVAMCNTELRLDLFPEDEADVSAYLNKQFYKFKP
ncbi:hypothetical protein [Polynucleobacter antarcticus]|uniref:Cytochrome c domain-containing protein n=1 Tax=Polynucleobacter antarcticus TaxID=1743162 RepID=A0A6M9PK74_9BURK|nr:hypothetical protein [Polynucleobacter antarcticus]QKM62544.1 hypothetical protein DCO16_05360 [Polynucleobacter antarcticus]